MSWCIFHGMSLQVVVRTIAWALSRRIMASYRTLFMTSHQCDVGRSIRDNLLGLRLSSCFLGFVDCNKSSFRLKCLEYRRVSLMHSIHADYRIHTYIAKQRLSRIDLPSPANPRHQSDQFTASPVGFLVRSRDLSVTWLRSVSSCHHHADAAREVVHPRVLEDDRMQAWSFQFLDASSGAESSQLMDNNY